MFETVRTILAKQLRLTEDKITPASDIKADLGADSLDIMELLMTIEDDYGITIPDEKLLTFRTVSDIVAYLEQNKKAV